MSLTRYWKTFGYFGVFINTLPRCFIRVHIRLKNACVPPNFNVHTARIGLEKNYAYRPVNRAYICSTHPHLQRRSDSMEVIVQLIKKSVIQICHVLKQNRRWQTADSPCPHEFDDPYIKSTMVSKFEIHFMTIFFSGHKQYWSDFMMP